MNCNIQCLDKKKRDKRREIDAPHRWKDTSKWLKDWLIEIIKDAGNWAIGRLTYPAGEDINEDTERIECQSQ